MKTNGIANVMNKSPRNVFKGLYIWVQGGKGQGKETPQELLKLYLRSRASKNILLYWGQNDPSVITPQKEIFGPPNRGGVEGWGAHLVSPHSRHFLGGSESVKKKWGSRSSLVLDMFVLVSSVRCQWGGIKTMALPCRQKP